MDRKDFDELVVRGNDLNNGSFNSSKIKDRGLIIYRSADPTPSFFSIGEEAAFRHTLLIGSSGSGKTTTMKQTIPQIRFGRSAEKNRRSAHFIFDTKGDYIEEPELFKKGDVVIGNSKKMRPRSVCWNLFEEVLADGNDIETVRMNANELAKILFAGRGSKSQPYFSNGAADIFAGAIMYFIYRFRDCYPKWKDNLNNKFLLDFLMRPPKDLAHYFSYYGDLKGLSFHIGNGENNQVLGVMGELKVMLKDCFQGVFASKPENGEKGFSVRKFIREKGGHALFLEYDMSIGETLLPMYKLITDLAMKESMGDEANGNVFFFLDELKLLPNCRHLDDLVNFGRSKGACVIAGLQSAEQLYAAYGREKGQVILGGFGNVFSYYSSDYESREYISKLFGPKVSLYVITRPDGKNEYHVKDGRVVEHWDITDLDEGTAIVKLVTQKDPFIFRFSEKIN